MRNTKPLSDEQLSYLIVRCNFEPLFWNGEVYLVLNKKTLYNIKKSFNIRMTGRKLTISTYTMELWISDFQEYNLIELQNVINTLIVTNQEVNVKSISRILEKNTTKVKIV